MRELWKHLNQVSKKTNLERERYWNLPGTLSLRRFLFNCSCWSTIDFPNNALFPCLHLMTVYWASALFFYFFILVAKDSVTAPVIMVFKDIFKNHPHCWIHLVLQPCSVLFPSVFLMLLSVALRKRAPWKPPRHQQDSKTVLFWLAGVLTPAACRRLKGGIFNSVELKVRSQPTTFLHFLFVKLTQAFSLSLLVLPTCL